MFVLPRRVLAGLRRRYAEPHRAYHGQAHVDALLAGLLAERAQLDDPLAAELAAWFHDAIYDPAAADNEARSAALLRAELRGLVPAPTLDAAEDMVRATAGHALPGGAAPRGDVATFLDLDVAVLGAAADEYDRYAAGIAAEYLPVHGWERFRPGRVAFLRAMLARPRLFHAERFHRRLDAPARANIARELRRLEASQAAEGSPPSGLPSRS